MRSQAILAIFIPVLILAVISIYNYANFIYSQSSQLTVHTKDFIGFVTARNSYCYVYKILNKSPALTQIDKIYNQMSTNIGSNIQVINNTIESNKFVSNCYG